MNQIDYIKTLYRHKVRTRLTVAALIFSVAIIGASLAFVDAQRQFAVQQSGFEHGTADAIIARPDTAVSPFFRYSGVTDHLRSEFDAIVSLVPRIVGEAEAMKAGALTGMQVTIVGRDPEVDDLLAIQVLRGTNPMKEGQVLVTASVADQLRLEPGDRLSMSYIREQPRLVHQEQVSTTSTIRADADFTVSGVGLVNGLGVDQDDAVLLSLGDAQAWLDTDSQANQVLVEWSAASAGWDLSAIVSRARDFGTQLSASLEADSDAAGVSFEVTLPKYERLDQEQQKYVFQLIFVSLYGLLCMGVIGIIVNALLHISVTEQLHEFAILRAMGASRRWLFTVVVMQAVLLGVVSVVIGVPLGRLINDVLLVRWLHANLSLTQAVQPIWTLQSVFIPTLITLGMVVLVSLNPARKASAARPAMAMNDTNTEQPRYEDLLTLRVRRPSVRLLTTGAVLLAFCMVILVLYPMVFSYGSQTAVGATYSVALICMGVGTSFIFAVLAPLVERLLLRTGRLRVQTITVTYFVERFSQRAKDRNALISLMVILATMFPSLLGTDSVLQRANLEADVRMAIGAPVVVRPAVVSRGVKQVFGSGQEHQSIPDALVDDVARDDTVDTWAGVAEGYQTELGDSARLRKASVEVIGIKGDLARAVFSPLATWMKGDFSAFANLTGKVPGVVMPASLAELLDVSVGDRVVLRGEGQDHDVNLIIKGVVRHLPGFEGKVSANRNIAQQGGAAIFVDLDVLRDAEHDPNTGPINPDESLITRLFLRPKPDVPPADVGRHLRANFAADKDLSFTLASETVRRLAATLDQERLFTWLLTALSVTTAWFGVLIVSYLTVFARRRELALMKAVGARPRVLLGTFVGEFLLITIAGTALGVAGGALLGYGMHVVQRLNRDIPMQWAFDGATALTLLVGLSAAAVISGAIAVRSVISQYLVGVLKAE